MPRFWTFFKQTWPERSQLKRDIDALHDHPDTAHSTNHESVHMRSHNNDKPYACDICGRAFTTGNLARHRRGRTHSSGTI